MDEDIARAVQSYRAGKADSLIFACCGRDLVRVTRRIPCFDSCDIEPSQESCANGQKVEARHDQQHKPYRRTY